MITDQKKWQETAESLSKIKQAIKYYKEMEEKYLFALKELSAFETSSNEVYVFELVIKPGAVDYGRIPQLKDVDLNGYRKMPVQSWTLREKTVLPVGFEMKEQL